MMIFWPAIRVSLIFVCIIIVSCKNPNLEGETSLKAYGGKEYKFAELPGYFVILVKADGDFGPLRELCSAAHIGDGFILTAAHCVNNLVCRSGMWGSRGVDGFGIKYIRRLWGRLYDGQIGRFGIKYIAQDGVMTMGFKDIESIVYHRGYYPDEQYQHNDDWVVTANDIALIKTHPPKPFAKAARLPLSSEERFGLQRIEGRLFFHGIGKHEKDGVRSFLDSDDSYSYFGGTIKVDRPSYLKPHETSHVKSEMDSLSVASSHDSLSPTANPNREVLPSCWQHPLPTNPKRRCKNPKRQEPLSCWQYFTYPGERLAVSRQLVIKNPVKNTVRVTADHAGRNGLKKVCYGDSGGPYVYSSEEEDILVGVHSSGTSRMRSRRCFSYGLFVSTFYHLSWIEKAKNSMTMGRNHSTSKLQ